MKHTKYGFLLLALLLAGCQGMNKKPLEGNRLLILPCAALLEPDLSLKDCEVLIPQAIENAEWSQAGGTASHRMPPLSFSGFNESWSLNIGAGMGRDTFITSEPIYHQGTLYALNAQGEVSAVDTKNREVLWRQETRPVNVKGTPLGGGLSYGEGKVFVASSYAEILALSAETGEVLWRTKVTSPVRSAPVIKEGRLFAVTLNNRLEVLNIQTGEKLWSHEGTGESASFLGGTAPAVAEGVVIVPYSSGEIMALRVENGHFLWAESLSAFKHGESLSLVSHIRALPVIDRDLVFIVGHRGRMFALDLRSGMRVWEKEIGGLSAPAIAGEFVFVIAHNNEVFCLERQSGKIKWRAALPQQEGNSSNGAIWHGPLVTEKGLILANSKGNLLLLNTADGQVIKETSFPGGTSVTPIIAEEVLYILTNDADIVAFH